MDAVKKQFKIATFNANSVRARLGIILAWLEKESPDILALQETKVQDSEFPRAPFEEAGWRLAIRGQKGYNGVAFVSKEPLEDVWDRLYPDLPEEEARFLHARWNGIEIINTYIPQGFLIESPKYQKKLQFFRDLRGYFDRLEIAGRPALWLGDLNVAPTEIDLAHPEANRDHVCFHVEARRALEAAARECWVDLFREKIKEPGHYTFWDFRRGISFERNIGWRIDHIFGTAAMVTRLEKIWVDKEPRAQVRPSDHTFLAATFSN